MNWVTNLVETIAADQESDGSFFSVSTPQGEPFGSHPSQRHTTFFTSLIGLCLDSLSDSRVDHIKEQIISFLRTQASANWSFNYWARDSPDAKLLPYPDDWDDTSLAIAALTRLNPLTVDGSVMAHVVKNLTATEVKIGGPYRTWFTSGSTQSAWQDIDLAVNANIAYLLKLHDVDLPSLSHLLEENAGDSRSKYYPTTTPVLYFQSRWYLGPAQKSLIKQLDGVLLAAIESGNVLEVALAITASLNLGVPASKLAPSMQWLHSQTDLAPYPMCFDPANAGRLYVAGTRAFTAAACLEANAKYIASDGMHPLVPKGKSEDTKLHLAVIANVEKRFEKFPDIVMSQWQLVRDQILTEDPAKQITLLPYLFVRAIGDEASHIDKHRLIELGSASLFGWLAYTIYDDFLDLEGDPASLPLANIALRELTMTYSRDPAEASIYSIALDQMEAANVWEVSNTRIGKQSDILRITPVNIKTSSLADRSIGHAVSCQVILQSLGYSQDSIQMRSLVEFFRHYLISRQLSDEAHDWKSDLLRGQVNAVASLLLRDTQPRGRTVTECYNRLERQFWEHSIEGVLATIEDHINLATSALNACSYMQHPEYLETLLTSVRNIVATTRANRSKALQFLSEYGA